jgi:hypothetical protein
MKHQKKPAPEHECAELERQAESLRRDIRKLQLEHDILKKANELIKKGMGIDPQLLSNREKTMLVDALKQTYPLPELLPVLRLARSSYFYHRARLLVADRHAGARRVIADIFECNHRCYGYRRIRAALNRQQVFISEKGRATFDATGGSGRCHDPATSLRLLSWRNKPRAGESHQS